MLCQLTAAHTEKVQDSTHRQDPPLKVSRCYQCNGSLYSASIPTQKSQYLAVPSWWGLQVVSHFPLARTGTPLQRQWQNVGWGYHRQGSPLSQLLSCPLKAPIASGNRGSMALAKAIGFDGGCSHLKLMIGIYIADYCKVIQ